MRIKPQEQADCIRKGSVIYTNLDNDIANTIRLYKLLDNKYGKAFTSIIETLDNDIFVPLHAFKNKGSYIGSLVAYLSVAHNYTPETIANILNRDIKAIRRIHSIVKDRLSTKEDIKPEAQLPILYISKEEAEEIKIPLTIFKNSQLSVLESIVKYLKEVYNLRFSKIAQLLSLNQRTVWTIYNRAVKKEIKK